MVGDLIRPYADAEKWKWETDVRQAKEDLETRDSAKVGVLALVLGLFGHYSTKATWDLYMVSSFFSLYGSAEESTLDLTYEQAQATAKRLAEAL